MRRYWTEATYAPVGGVYYRQPDGMLVWRHGTEVRAVSIEQVGDPSAPLLRIEAPEGDARDVFDERVPVRPDVLAAWIEERRERLNAQIEKALADLAQAEERAAEARRVLWLLRADLAALEGGAT